jgi:hypothetical protein
MGMIIHPSEKFHLGMLVRDPQGGNDPAALPALYVLGFGYQAESQFCIQAEIIKEEEQPAGCSARIQFRIDPAFRIRAGLAAPNDMFWFGAGWKKGRFGIDISTAYHLQLGITPSVQWVMEFTSKKK